MILCENCGNQMPERVGNNNSRRYPPHCMKPECRRVYYTYRKKKKDEDKPLPYFKTPEAYDPVEFNALGEAVKPDIFKKLVDGSGRSCKSCRWNDTCRARVKVGLWLACESPAKHERQFVEQNEKMMYTLVKLSTVVIG